MKLNKESDIIKVLFVPINLLEYLSVRHSDTNNINKDALRSLTLYSQ